MVSGPNLVARVEYSSLGVNDPTASGQDDPASPSSHAIASTLSEDERSAMIGMGKVIEIFQLAEKSGSCAVEHDSVYGAAITMPQLGRSTKWPISMIVLVGRTYMFLLLNYLVQYGAVYYIYDEQTNMSPFAGQMHLCDFGAGIQQCPGGNNCLGPGGTDYDNPGRLYSYDIWSTRTFFRDTLKQIFPERAEELHSLVDPGEYGVESYTCRLLCIFIFIVQIADEFESIVNLFWMIWHLPSNSKSWVAYDPPDWGPKEYVKKVHGHTELELVTFQVQGMPLFWKIVNVFLILIPRTLLWKNLSFAGVYFLMETAGMMDEIINTTALAFILSFDELILERLTSNMARHIMGNIEDYKFFDPTVHDKVSDDEVVENFISHELGCGNLRRLWKLVPRRLLWTLSLMGFFLCEYYFTNCQRDADGSWVSVDMYLPAKAHLDPLCLIIHCHSHPHGEEAFWTMPNAKQEV